MNNFGVRLLTESGQGAASATKGAKHFIGRDRKLLEPMSGFSDGSQLFSEEGPGSHITRSGRVPSDGGMIGKEQAP
jgi:hypothetical protein